MPCNSKRASSIPGQLFLVAFLMMSDFSFVFSQEEADSVTSTPPPHNGEFPVATLHNGITIPLVGLGCASGVGEKHVESALDAGYRFIDTAQAYQWGYREDEVGTAVSNSPVDRNDVFIQSKIHPENLGYDASKRVFPVSLQRLQVDVLDSMLLHKPRCWEGACSIKPEGTWQESWKALEELYEAGQVRAIGICDVDHRILDQLLQQKIKPHIIQNWMDPFNQDKEMRQRCQKEGIQYQAYSTLGTQWLHFRGHKRNPLFTNPTLQSIAHTHDCDVAQVVINWATRHGVSVLPASTNTARQKSNLKSFEFDLTDAEMEAIDALDGTLDNVEPDPNEVSLVFENQGSVKVNAFWVGSEEEVPVGEIAANDSLSLNSYHGHKFIFKEASGGVVIGEHTVVRDDGSEQRHVVNHHSEL